jgi:hypothetical protein
LKAPHCRSVQFRETKARKTPLGTACADKEGMSQHPKVTIGWAIAGLETAITKLADGPAERRVRAQFHQLLLALERARLPIDLHDPDATDRAPALRD